MFDPNRANVTLVRKPNFQLYVLRLEGQSWRGSLQALGVKEDLPEPTHKEWVPITGGVEEMLRAADSIFRYGASSLTGSIAIRLLVAKLVWDLHEAQTEIEHGRLPATIIGGKGEQVL